MEIFFNEKNNMVAVNWIVHENPYETWKIFIWYFCFVLYLFKLENSVYKAISSKSFPSHFCFLHHHLFNWISFISISLKKRMCIRMIFGHCVHSAESIKTTLYIAHQRFYHICLLKRLSFAVAVNVFHDEKQEREWNSNGIDFISLPSVNKTFKNIHSKHK